MAGSKFYMRTTDQGKPYDEENQFLFCQMRKFANRHGVKCSMSDVQGVNTDDGYMYYKVVRIPVNVFDGDVRTDEMLKRMLVKRIEHLNMQDERTVLDRVTTGNACEGNCEE